MKKILFIIFLSLSLSSYSQKLDTIKIKDNKIIIIEPGFNSWLKNKAEPKGFYTLEYLESCNKFYVSYWNNMVLNSDKKTTYKSYVDYDFNIKYGYEINYLLFNYFQYYMYRTGQRVRMRK